ncbi:YkgJ family cysteine cluster protein [uncultured Abyssibacter sp.]|uniref:YkgJ family cysteine cluster protein n=1 Tax=uncultured Abyssibacter sp. TaxID=2320202 RepID=UPI0032B2A150
MVTDLSGTGWVHPCLRCGACCAHYRASFYWAEGDDVTPGGVPVQLTARLTPHRRVMLGTDQPKPRCIALQGTVGERVYCSIHPLRASVCRDYVPSFEDGQHHARCDEARAVHGLPPLTPADWSEERPDDDSPTRPPRLPRAA